MPYSQLKCILGIHHSETFISSGPLGSMNPLSVNLLPSFTERTGKGDTRFSRHFFEWQGKCCILGFPAICWDVMIYRMRRHPKWPFGYESSNMEDRMWCHPQWSTGYDVIQHGRPDMTSDGQIVLRTRFALWFLKNENKKKMSSFKSNGKIHKKENCSYYVVSATKASSVIL